jgi:hypothetical protein
MVLARERRKASRMTRSQQGREAMRASSPLLAALLNESRVPYSSPSSSLLFSLASGCVSWKLTLSSLPGRVNQAIALRDFIAGFAAYIKSVTCEGNCIFII